MSALTERVAREHRPYRDPVAPGRLWLCGCDQGETSRDIVAHVRHIAEATEAAVRAAVAAEIDSVGHHWSGAPALAFFALATDIREGK